MKKLTSMVVALSILTLASGVYAGKSSKKTTQPKDIGTCVQSMELGSCAPAREVCYYKDKTVIKDKSYDAKTKLCVVKEEVIAKQKGK